MVGIAAALYGAKVWIDGQVASMPEGEEFYVRWEGESFESAANELKERGVVRNVDALKVYARWRKGFVAPDNGTYQFRPGMTADQILAAMHEPVKQMVRIPEGRWIAWVGSILEEKGVCTQADYVEAANDPARFAEDVSFPLPEGSLEGYLYPDTYELPPLLGADGVIERQLQAFEAKVWDKLEGHPDPNRILTIASMVELEAALDRERPMVAAVIENRLRIDMPLQIDATVNYARQEWGVLPPNFVRTVKSPYNTYLNRGLPPGPIGSPGAASIEGALEPASHDFLFYVARPDRSHYFTRTYAEHRRMINKARQEAQGQ